MPIVVANRRSSHDNLRKKYGSSVILDVTSRGGEPWVQFSPFFPHGGIPVPFSPGETGMSVEGIWQALKVFDSEDVDRSKLAVTNMQGLKRTVRRLGNVKGHRQGLDGAELLPYRAARELIYLPCYRWVLDHRLVGPLAELRRLNERETVILLDYQTNGDIDDLRTPLSHAALIKRYLEDDWPVQAHVGNESTETRNVPGS